MAILLTGGSGYVGSHLILALQERGDKIVNLDNLSNPSHTVVHPNVTFVEGSVGDEALVSKLLEEHKINSILHLAGYDNPELSVSDPVDYYFNNTCHSHTLLKCAVRAGVSSFVYSSTAAVYGKPGRIPVDEASLPNPESSFGASKLMTELMLRDIARAHNLKYAILRSFNIAGADPQARSGQSGAGANYLVKLACQVALGKQANLTIYGNDYPTPDGTCIRDYVHVSDLADAHIKTLAYLVSGGDSQIFNVGNGLGYSVQEVVDAVSRVSGENVMVKSGPRRQGDVPELVAATSKIRNLLRWEPKFDDLDTIVEHALCWEKQLPNDDVGY